MPNFN